MQFPVSNRALMLAGVLVFAGTTACSRSDRSESGSDNSAAITQDTTGTTAGTSAAADTTTTTGTATETGAVAGDTAAAQVRSDAPRAATATPSAEDTAAAGYRAMERDTVNVPESDSVRVTEDTSGTSLNITDTITDTSSAEIAVAVDTAITDADVGDTAAVGYTEMARDTSTTADQIDTTGATVAADGAADVAVADTTGNAGRIRPPEDSTEILGQVTTDTTASVAIADTVESERIRPPEDSTELLGNIGDETADEQEVTDEQEINANEEAISADERETVAAAETPAAETPADEVGAAAIGGAVTGTDAIALMTRQGLRCNVVDPEANEEVRWDMSSTPVTLNPCGLGSMNLSRIWTEGSGEQE